MQVTNLHRQQLPDALRKKLLGHPLRQVRQVRQGAIQALILRREPALLRRLDEERAARKDSQDATDAVFRHAAYRAIDQTLYHLEHKGSQEDFAALQAWFDETGDEAVKGRVEWTLGWMEHWLEQDEPRIKANKRE